MTNRRLTTIVAADVVGYSRLMHADESGTRAAFNRARLLIIEPKVSQHDGRVIKEMGDGLLFEFSSVVDAVTFAGDLQAHLGDQKSPNGEKSSLVFRIGVNIGDVIAEGDDLHGDGVNVATRLEGICEPGGVCMSDAVYKQISNKLDLNFEDLGEKNVKNIPVPIRAWSLCFDDKARSLKTPVINVSDLEPSKRNIFKRPLIAAGFLAILAIVTAYYFHHWKPSEVAGEAASLAVMPFDNLEAGNSRQYIADGITNDIISDLSKFRELFVISANSSFTYKNREVTAQAAAQELGVRYIVEGSVQWGEERFRVNVQLTDADEDRSIWSDRFDRQSVDLFDVQDEIIKKIVAALSFRVDSAEETAALKKETDSLKAYDLYLRGVYYYQNESETGYRKAVKLLDQAIQESPDYAKAKGYLAWMLRQGASWGWENDKEAARNRSFELALEALKLDPADAFIHSVLGHQYLFRREYEKSESAFETAVELNPNDPDLLVDASQPLIYLGKPNEAVELIDRAMQISPNFPGWYHGIRGWALTDARRYQEAIVSLRKMHKPRAWVHRQLAISLVGLNRVDEPRKEIEIMLQKQPDYRLSSVEQSAKDWPYKETAALETSYKNLKIAGAPE